MFERNNPRKSKEIIIGEWGRGDIAEAVFLGGKRVWSVTVEEIGFASADPLQQQVGGQRADATGRCGAQIL